MSNPAEIVEVEIECPACNASGLCRKINTPVGIAEVCRKCEGSGKTLIKYVPFTGRKEVSGIMVVCRDSYNIPLTVRTGAEDITYAEFLAGKLPPNNCRA